MKRETSNVKSEKKDEKKACLSRDGVKKGKAKSKKVKRVFQKWDALFLSTPYSHNLATCLQAGFKS
jgi:hypothetical protein